MHSSDRTFQRAAAAATSIVRAVAPSGTAPAVMALPQPMAMAMPAFGGGYPALPSTPADAAAAAMPSDPASIEAPRTRAEAAPRRDEVVVQAPIVGTFYHAPSPDSAPFVEVGDTVKPGDVLCIIEAMKLMNEIQSEHAGTVRQILVGNAEPVEYDQPLFVIEKA